MDNGHNREISWPQRPQQNGDAHVLTDSFHKKWKHKSTKNLNRINISSTSSRKDPIASRRFSSPNPSSRGHGRICPAHPPLPRPRWAARRRKRCRSRPREAAVWRLGSCGPRAPKPAGRTQRNGRGEKFWENLGTSKIESFGNLVAIQTPLGCKEQFVGLRCLEAIELVETAMWTMLAAWVWIHVESESYWIQSGSNVGISRQMHWHLSNQAGIPNPEISFRVQSRWLG